MSSQNRRRRGSGAIIWTSRRAPHEVDPVVVAVVGSYGKTSTKHVLAQLLQPQVNTLPTRKSFNTLMGVTRVINEDLTSDDKVFVVEMDAYAPGEIATMSSLVHPRIAIVTAIGPQHMERFGRWIASPARCMRSSRHCRRWHADPVYRRRVRRGACAAGTRGAAADDPLRAGTDGEAVDADIVASSIQVTAHGSTFRWRWDAEGLDRQITIPLLGRHQVANVSAALAAVHTLGYPIDDAIAAAAALEQVEHRLQVYGDRRPVDGDRRLLQRKPRWRA